MTFDPIATAQKARNFKTSLEKLRSVMGDLREVTGGRKRQKQPRNERKTRNKTSVSSVPSVVKKKKSCNKDCGGVGTELMAILAELGMTAKPTCPCKSLAKEMDKKGIEWCERGIDSLVKAMQENAKYFAWHEKAGVGLRALPLIVSGKLNPLRPLHSLITLAIERARAKEGTCCAK